MIEPNIKSCVLKLVSWSPIIIASSVEKYSIWIDKAQNWSYIGQLCADQRLVRSRLYNTRLAKDRLPNNQELIV